MAALITLMQVVNQLGEIFNGIDIVVGRGGDEGNTGLRFTQTGNVGVDLGLLVDRLGEGFMGVYGLVRYVK